MTALIIKRRGTDEEVRRIDTTGKTPDAITRIEEGMAINFDWERFYWTEES